MKVFESEVKQLMDPGAEPQPVVDGFEFLEGPVWHFGGRHLTFVDLAGDAMYRWSEAKGLRTLRRPSEHANGLAYDPQGVLLSCEHRTRRITRDSPDGPVPVVERYRGMRLNAPNDLVVSGDGSIVFTDPHYGLQEGYGGPGEQEQPVKGVYRLAPDREEPELLVDDFEGPNGLALAPDERRLIVADSERGHLRTFDVAEGWRVSGGEVLVSFPAEGEGVPDGLKFDLQGNLYATGPGGLWICASGGRILGHVPFPEIAANLAWGEDDAATMYVTASTTLYRLATEATGHVPHRAWTR
jgi:gluconolactonase